MKKLLGTLLLAPLAVTACSDAAKAPTSIDVPMPADAKQKVIVEFHNATKNLGTTDLTAWGEACDKYFDASFSMSSGSSMKNCKDYHVGMLKDAESMGVESGIKAWDWKDMSGDDTAGWTVPALIKVESKITNQAKFDKLVDEQLKLVQSIVPSTTREDMVKQFTDSFDKGLKFGTLYTYKLIKSGDSYKIKSFTTALQSA